MKYVFVVIIALSYTFFLLPYVKTYQLKGYNINLYFNNIYSLKMFFHGKTPLKYTKRVLRLLICFVVCEFFIWLLILEQIDEWWIIFIDLTVNLIFLPFLLIILHYFLLPFEFLIKKYYLFRTKRKLKKFKGIKIAVTGSFGKTSTKNILKQMLESKYKVTATPLNYNTPMGLCKTVLKELKEDDEILIVEMGARHKGDIKELCDIVQPDIGILTSIGHQHIETFSTIENVLMTKFELCESLSPSKICFFDCYNEYAASLYKKATCKKVGLGKEFLIKDKRMSHSGINFKLCSSKTDMELSSKLLGEYMTRNIALCAVVSMHLKVNERDIQKVANKLKPTPHRLEIISRGNLIILDDSYNSNFDGFKEALAVLKMFDGNKIVISPGLVELGGKQYEFNFKIGKEIASSCDYVIIMNKTNKTALKNGLKSERFKKEKIFFADTREEQKEILSKLIKGKTIVLFENDLPDDYK